MKLELTETAQRELQTMDVPELLVFPSDFVSKFSGTIARCLDADGKPFSIKSGNSYEVNFDEPAYVSSVEIEFSKAVAGTGIELAVHEALNHKVLKKRLIERTLSAIAPFSVNCVSSGLSIYLQPGILELLSRRTLEIKQIRIAGYFIEDFEALNGALNRIVGLKQTASDELSREKSSLLALQNSIQAREVAVEELEDQKNAELESLQTQIDERTEEVEKANLQLSELKEDIRRAVGQKQITIEQVAKNEATVREIEGEIEKGKARLREIAVETSEKESKLRDLSSNVNLFSEEFSSFSDHGGKQAKVFIGLSLIPLTIIGILTLQLLMGAVDLSVKYVEEPNLDLLTIFVTRLPYLTICGSILGVCFSLCRFLFNRVSSIFAERLDFAKIGILAKDIASASGHGVPVSEQELYEARTYLKIEMLKAYLSGNIGVFTYAKRTKHELTSDGSSRASSETDPKVHIDDDETAQ